MASARFVTKGDSFFNIIKGVCPLGHKFVGSHMKNHTNRAYLPVTKRSQRVTNGHKPKEKGHRAVTNGHKPHENYKKGIKGACPPGHKSVCSHMKTTQIWLYRHSQSGHNGSETVTHPMKMDIERSRTVTTLTKIR